jgi:uncharacterized membrane protein YedE/YeeE
MPGSWLSALAGGAMIGAAAAILLLAHGRVAGVSGIVGSLLPPAAGDRAWRLAFLAGLLAAGVVGHIVAPDTVGASVRSLPVVVIGGLLVGFGTRLGGGCTSGHGVCGIARLSRRSLLAVAIFISTGLLTVWLAGGAP